MSASVAMTKREKEPVGEKEKPVWPPSTTFRLVDHVRRRYRQRILGLTDDPVGEALKTYDSEILDEVRKTRPTKGKTAKLVQLYAQKNYYLRTRKTPYLTGNYFITANFDKGIAFLLDPSDRPDERGVFYVVSVYTFEEVKRFDAMLKDVVLRVGFEGEGGEKENLAPESPKS
jgi:hypothetical protein